MSLDKAIEHGNDSWMMGSHKKAYILANMALVDAYLDMMEEEDGAL